MPLVQSGGLFGSGSAASGTFGSNVNSGDLLLAFAAEYNATPGSLISVLDTLGNSYLPILGPIATTNVQIWLLATTSAIGGPAPTITATYSAAASLPFIGWAEFSGNYSLDATNTASGNSMAYSASVTTTGANDICVSFWGNSGQGITAGPESISLFNPGVVVLGEYLTAATPGLQTQTASSLQALWVGIIAAFKPVIPGPPATTAVFPLPVYKAIGIL